MSLKRLLFTGFWLLYGGMVTSTFSQVYDFPKHFSSEEIKENRVKGRTVYAYDYEGDKPTQTARQVLSEAFNQRGQLTERTFEKAGVLPPYKTLTLLYTEEGCLSRQIEVGFSDSVRSRSVSSCDSLGRTREILRYGPTGEVEQQTLYTYEADHWKYKFLLDSIGDTLYSFRHEQEKGEDEKVYRSIHPGDFMLYGVKTKDTEKGTQQWVNTNEDGAVLLRETWQYDDKGQLVIYEQFDAERNSKWAWRLQYNAKGLPELSQFLKDDRAVWVERYLYTYY